eukprot:gene38828-51039_t
MSVSASSAHSWRRLITTRSHGYGRLDGRMVLVVLNLEVFEVVFEDAGRAAFDVQAGVGHGLARELQFHLLVVVAVDVAVTTGPDELAHVQVALLGQHVGEQRVAGDVEGHAEEDVG